jgi:hypothetical protein
VDPPAAETSLPLLTWALTTDIIHEMDESSIILDDAGIELICCTAFNAALAARTLGVNRENAASASVTPMPEQSVQEQREYEEARLLMRDCSYFLRRRFIRYVGLDKEADIFKKNWQSDGATVSQHLGIPRHLAVPTPGLLHHYLRALGILGDYEGVLTLVKWMVDAAKDIDELAETTLNGHKRMRRVLVALRVFLEYPSRDYVLADREIEMQPASDEIIMLVKKAVESVGIWDGWPTDDEVDRYCTRQHRR